MTKSDLLRTAADVCTWQDGRRGDSLVWLAERLHKTALKPREIPFLFRRFASARCVPLKCREVRVFVSFLCTCLAWEIPSHGQNKQVQTYAMNSRGRSCLERKRCARQFFVWREMEFGMRLAIKKKCSLRLTRFHFGMTLTRLPTDGGQKMRK